MKNDMHPRTSRWTTVIGILVAIISLALCAAGGYLAWKKTSKPAATATPSKQSSLQRTAAELIQRVAPQAPISFEGKPIPSGPEVMTQAKHLANYRAWQMRKVTEAWRKAHPDQKPNTEAERVLTDAWLLIQGRDGASKPAEIQKRVQALPAAQAGDPLMRLTITMISEDTEENATALRKLQEEEKELRNAHYPLLFAAYAQLEQQNMLSTMNNQQAAADLITAGVDTLAEAMQNGEFTADETAYVYRVITKMVYFALKDDAWNRIGQTVLKRTKLDPWLRDILIGQSEIGQAWAARGGGWANSVNEPGWHAFELHLQQARTALTDAWRRRPEWPQGATLMITVTMGGQGEPGVSSRDWFDRAVAARMDFTDAYDALRQDLLPRWHGTTDAMAKFAQECLNTGRFDTDVPFYYFLTINQSGSDMPPGTWRRAFRQAEAAANLDRMFAGYQKEPSRADKRFVWQARQAVALAWCGNYARAQELMKTLAPEDQLDWAQVVGPFTLGRIDRKTFQAELRAFTGPLKETLTRADALQCSGQAAEAIQLFGTAMNESKADAAVFGYLRDRIASLELDIIEQHSAENYWMARLALHRSLYDNQPQLTKFLIEAGADLNVPLETGWLPVQVPLSQGKFDLVKLMVEHGADINRTSSVSNTPLIMAIETNQFPVAEYLLAHGANPNLGAKGRLTPLFYAIMRDRWEMANLLVQKGADVNLVTGHFGTPLSEAAKVGNPEMVKMLLAHGANPNLPLGDTAKTPLMKTGEKGNTAIARLLLEKGADPNAIYQKSTALHYAAYYGQADVARLLLEKGARLDLKDSDGKTPLDVARQQKKEDVVMILEQAHNTKK